MTLVPPSVRPTDAGTGGRTRRAVASALILALSLAAAMPAPSAAGSGDPEEGGPARRYVVRFAAALDPPARLAALDGLGLRFVDQIDGSGFVLAEGTADAAAAAADDTRVIDVRAPKRMEAFADPNDPLFPVQWHLPAIQVPQAWDVTRGDGAVVAVLDTGVDQTLRDFAGTRFVAGIDLVNGDADATDDHGHGSHVAGTIAQTAGNGFGVASVAPRAAVMPVKVLDGAGAGTDFTLAKGLHWAADNGADVANLSLGGVNGSPVLEEAVNYATARGVTVVAAVGNDGADRVGYPAAYPNVIAVGAVRYDLARAPYSNRGAAVELVGPGGDTTVDQNGDGYPDGVLQQTVSPAGTAPTCFCFYQGTSMATPHAAGVAALLVAAGTSDPTAVRAALADSALDLGPTGRDDSFGHGLVQAHAALQAAADAIPDPIPAPARPSPDGPVADEPENPPLSTGARSIDDVCPQDEVPPAPFDDVPSSNPHQRPIACLAWRDIVNGLGPDSFGPGEPVRRDQMASFIARLLEEVDAPLPASPPDAFDDDARSVHQTRINQVAAIQIISGTAAGKFEPATAVTRAQMATFLARTVEYVIGEPIDPVLDQFDDDDGNPHEGSIDAVATVGIAAGTGFREFSPTTAVRRDQMASFLARTLAYLADNGHPPST